MTFERLANASLYLGLSMNEILELPIGLTLGLLNDKNNQQIENQNKDKKDVIQGDAKMLMGL